MAGDGARLCAGSRQDVDFSALYRYNVSQGVDIMGIFESIKKKFLDSIQKDLEYVALRSQLALLEQAAKEERREAQRKEKEALRREQKGKK